MLSRAVNVTHAFALDQRQLLTFEHLRETKDGVERRPQLMAHARKKFALRIVCAFGFVFGLLQGRRLLSSAA